MENITKPPYVSYKTFINTLNALGTDGVPSVLDSSVLHTMSGTVQSQLKVALRFMNLIDDEDRTQPIFEQLAYATDEERKEFLKEILLSSYHFLFDDPEFDLSVGTAQQFERKFKETGIDGDTVRKAQTFFINLATDAGIPVSKFITRTRSRTSQSQSKPRRKPSNRTKQTSNINETTQPSTKERTTHVDPRAAALYSHFEKFPEYNPEWDEETRRVWLEDYGHILRMLDDDLDEESEEVE